MNKTHIRATFLIGIMLLSVIAVGGPMIVTAEDPGDDDDGEELELSVPDQDVTIVEGAEITIESADTASINVDTIPEDWEVEDISDDGDFFDSTGDVNWDFGVRDDREVTFTLVPPENATVGDTIELSALNDRGETDDFTVTVVEAPTELNLTVNETDLVEGDTVEFTVLDNETDEAVENVTIEIRNDSVTTGENGTATYTFEEPGEYTATATKADTDEESFEDDSFGLSVDSEAHESGVDRDTADAVAGLTGDDDEESDVTGGDMTVLRGNLLDGDTELDDDVEVSGADYTLLRGWLADQ